METPLSSASAPALGALVRAASSALARLDASRLTELAEACAALNRDLSARADQAGDAWEDEVREALGEMAVFARVLAATRANLKVMDRLRDLRESRVEYSERQAVGWRAGEDGDGDH